ncbi:MAG: HAD-IC family P-type ATPase [Dehalococcoidales bacterium]|nr:HAD-IC family P-type ATPase [Dehalococcoidales bacterium]
MISANKWYQLSDKQTFEKIETSTSGLSSTEAKERLSKYGYNELGYKKPSILMRLVRQFQSPLVYILLVAALITGILSVGGEDMWMDTWVILGVVILNVIIGFFQEGKAENALGALREMIVPECTVRRDGEEKIIQTRELVPGDIVILNSGDRIPADLRLFLTKNMAADESALTGESVPAEKDTEQITRPDLSPADQRCIAFSGTFITRGIGQGIVVNTGEKTEFGKIANLVKEAKTVTTPLQKKIIGFTKTLIILILSLGAINFILGFAFGYKISYSFLASVALIVAAIPEMLPMIVTGILALAGTAMAKRNALIRRLPAAETLGCTTVICSDKTGTLTKNEMTVLRIYSGGKDYYVNGVGYEPTGEFVLNDKVIKNIENNKDLTEILKAGYFCNNASLQNDNGRYYIIGDPTEGALVVSAVKAGISNIQKLPKLDEIPFESELQYMATLHNGGNNNILYVKGSPEKIMAMCQNQLADGKTQPLQKEVIQKKSDEAAQEALRLLGMAMKAVPKDKISLTLEDLTDLTFLGFQGMIDPPREEAIDAIAKCKTAGIRSIMITGDHILTAKAIARKLGIIGENEDSALTGEELSRMSDEELYEAVKTVSVYARVAPEHKLRIARQLQNNGEIVAMTGDGVNDAPALKIADIGIAMGITGTEVSKEAADMVLTDDNFASIVGAVEEGRHAWKNLEKAILYTLPTNGGQALLVMGAILIAPFFFLFHTQLPLSPVQILWVNLFDSVFLTMPLMMEPKEHGLLLQPPRDPKEKIANRLFFERVGLVSIVMAATAFLIYLYYGSPAIEGKTVIDEALLLQAQSAAFLAVAMVHVGFAMTARSIFDSAFTFNPFSNRWLLAGILVTIITDITIVYWGPLQNVFGTTSIPISWWIYIIPCILPGFIAVEIEKLIRKKSGKVE